MFAILRAVIFSQLDQYDVAQAEGGDMGRFDEGYQSGFIAGVGDSALAPQTCHPSMGCMKPADWPAPEE